MSLSAVKASEMDEGPSPPKANIDLFVELIWDRRNPVPDITDIRVDIRRCRVKWDGQDATSEVKEYSNENRGATNRLLKAFISYKLYGNNRVLTHLRTIYNGQNPGVGNRGQNYRRLFGSESNKPGRLQLILEPVGGEYLKVVERVLSRSSVNVFVRELPVDYAEASDAALNAIYHGIDAQSGCFRSQSTVINIEDLSGVGQMGELSVNSAETVQDEGERVEVDRAGLAASGIPITGAESEARPADSSESACRDRASIAANPCNPSVWQNAPAFGMSSLQMLRQSWIARICVLAGLAAAIIPVTHAFRRVPLPTIVWQHVNLMAVAMDEEQVRQQLPDHVISRANDGALQNVDSGSRQAFRQLRPANVISDTPSEVLFLCRIVSDDPLTAMFDVSTIADAAVVTEWWQADDAPIPLLDKRLLFPDDLKNTQLSAAEFDLPAEDGVKVDGWIAVWILPLNEECMLQFSKEPPLPETSGSQPARIVNPPWTLTLKN
jgi:hypothetical protein